MVRLNLTVGGDEGSSSPKVLVYQRTPTPRYEHWPQSPTVKRDTPAGSQSSPDAEKHSDNSEMVNTITKLDTPHSDSTDSSNISSNDPPDNSRDPPGNSRDLDNSSKDPQDCSHHPESSHDQKNIPVSDVHNNSDNTDSIHDSQDLNSQANS